MGFTSLNIAVSGLRAAQTGLSVTGHNLANSEVSGFARQRSIQNEVNTRTLGTSMAGNQLRVGMGVDNGAIHHIRSQYFDMMYRMHNSRLNFYMTKTAIGQHIETILGETEGSFRMQNQLSDMWNSMHELNVSLGGIEARDLFIANSISFLSKAQNIFDELFEYQRNLDGQVRNMVNDINNIVAGIHRLNVQIEGLEVTGDNANDLRDERHRLLDRLSGLVPMDYFENHTTGRIDITTINGNFLLSQGTQNILGLKFISGHYSLVEPVFTSVSGILPSDTPPENYVPFFSWNRPINAANNNDEGALMALLHARGAMPATYAGMDALWTPLPPGSPPQRSDFAAGAFGDLEFANAERQFQTLYPLSVTDPGAFTAAVANPRHEIHGHFRAAQRTYMQAAWSKEHAFIPRVMMQMDQIVNSVVRLINDSLAPVADHMRDIGNAPFDLNETRSFTEVFVRRHEPRFNANGIHNPGMAGDIESRYTTRNLMINPLLLQSGGYNLLALSLSGDREDTRVIQEMLRQWSLDDGDFSIEIGGQTFSIDRAYGIFITALAVEIKEADTFLSSQFLQTVQADTRRNAIMGVASDEELSNMMTFQFAYQAAARLFNIIDSMIETVITRTGRVGT